MILRQARRNCDIEVHERRKLHNTILELRGNIRVFVRSHTRARVLTHARARIHTHTHARARTCTQTHRLTPRARQPGARAAVLHR